MEIASLPPVLSATATRPAAMVTEPPAPLEPLPIVKNVEPPPPAVAAPEPRQIAPELLVITVPELKDRKPVDPHRPLLEPMTNRDPLLVIVPSPVVITRPPPNRRFARPAEPTATPPEPLVPEPALMCNKPPVPPVFAPVPRNKTPELPPQADPELKTRRLLAPA